MSYRCKVFDRETWKSLNQDGWDLFLVEVLVLSGWSRITLSGGYSVWRKDEGDVEKSEVKGSCKANDSEVLSLTFIALVGNPEIN